MKKKQVVERIDSFPLGDLHGPLDDAIVRLQKLQKDHHVHSSLQLQLNGDSEMDYEYEVWGTRLETDEEQSRRVTLAKAAKDRRLAQKQAEEVCERAEYERLKNKFGVEYY